ncbi:hypothetical protein [Flavobacterium sp. UMI-01]|uniref:hypothetical protein n=1 Tax=Flavobacterium sp. UMI-01 TaxID=1441053 RepID=UPI001C7D7611|nr:hypothetical protein [Flavobacterium sp. UMI-01]GIZ07755.1 hypothetical protein FUMI01_04820 [Flavobacterium sp. UMI-01]
MKNFRLKSTLILIFLFIVSNAQVINWGNIEQNNTISTGIGLEYGSIYSFGYGHKIDNGKSPIILNTEIAIPFGEKKIDDFKTKVGGIIRILKFKNLNIGLKINGVFRVYNNDFVRILNFGSDFSTTIGYYKPKWFIATEFGFDKAIVSNFTHSALYKSNFTDVKDGWYEPSTGGNFYYGIQSGYSFKKHDITFKVGKIFAQDFKTPPLIPYYLQLGYAIRFNTKKE